MDNVLEARAAVVAQNEQRSRTELGESAAILDVGFELLEHLAFQASEGLKRHPDDHARKAITFLSFLVASRAGSTCALLLQGFPTDSACLMRSLLEACAMQELFERNEKRALDWLRGAEIKDKEVLRAVDEASLLKKTWVQLGRVVHPNLTAVENQLTADGDSFRALATGVIRPQQLLTITANFGVFTVREIRVVERNLTLSWSEEDRDKVVRISSLTEALQADIQTRWPASDVPRPATNAPNSG